MQMVALNSIALILTQVHKDKLAPLNLTDNCDSPNY